MFNYINWLPDRLCFFWILTFENWQQGFYAYLKHNDHVDVYYQMK